jgi:hypothetical protein
MPRIEFREQIMEWAVWGVVGVAGAIALTALVNALDCCID